MSEKIVDEEFEAAEQKVEASHQQAVAELREKVQRAKSAALKKLSP